MTLVCYNMNYCLHSYGDNFYKILKALESMKAIYTIFLIIYKEFNGNPLRTFNAYFPDYQSNTANAAIV